jgi:CheY-like chemotaxis protein
MADLSEHLGRSRSGSSESKSGILLVDDSPANLLSLRAILADLGQHLVEARSGEEALERLKAEEFAVVLLDVLMPGRSGFETARLIRGDERSRHTPIIFLTAGDIDRPQLEEGYALGAVDFLGKPLLPVVLRAKVRGSSNSSRTRCGRGGRPSSFGSSSTGPPSTPSSCSTRKATSPPGTPGPSA